MTVTTQQELVERIWARDATVWTGADEDKWLGWLDEPKRMQERIGDLQRFAAEARAEFETAAGLDPRFPEPSRHLREMGVAAPLSGERS